MSSTTATARVHKAISDCWRENAIPPTVRTIQKLTGIKSTSAVHWHYLKLEKAGMIKRICGKPVPIEIYILLTQGESHT